MSFWPASAEAGPSRSPTKTLIASPSKHESHVPSFLVRSATEHDLYNVDQKSLHTFAYGGGLAHSSPSTETSSAFSPPGLYRTTFSNPSSSSVSSSGHPRSASHRNSFSSVSVSEMGSSAMSDRLSWSRANRRQSKRSSHDAKIGGSVRGFDQTRKDGGRLRSHTEGSQASNPNSGDIFLYSSRNLDAGADRSNHPRLLHQRRKSDGPQRSKLDAAFDSFPSGRSHRILRSQSSNSLSHAFFEPRGHKHQSKNSAHSISLSLVKDEDERLESTASRLAMPSSPLRESEMFTDWHDQAALPPSWRTVDDHDSLDRLAMMSPSSSSKTLRRRSGDVVTVAARSAAQATKKGLRVIRRAGSFDVGSKSSADAAKDRERSRSNSSSALFTSLGLVPRPELRHQRSQTLHQLEATTHDVAPKSNPALLSLPTSAAQSPKLHGLGFYGEATRSHAWRFSQITEAEDEDKSFSKELPQIPPQQETTPSSESDQELLLQRSDSSGASGKDEPKLPRPIAKEPRPTLAEPTRVEPQSPSRSESERRHGLAKRSYAALIDLLHPTLHKEGKSRSRDPQASLGGAEPVHMLAHGDHGGRAPSGGASSGYNGSRARGNSSAGRSNGIFGGGGGGGGGAGQSGGDSGGGAAGGGGPPDRRGGGPPSRGGANSSSDANPPVNSVYRRLELVGRGAYGAVYRGVHVETGAAVALKVVNLDTPDDDVSDIQREVALLSQLREAASKNVVRYWGCWLKGPELWIVMDFAEGGSVRTLMKAGPIAERYCAVIVRETLVALNYLHKSGIIHRDIKAANILLTSTGRILLCDFGVAASLASNSVHSKRSTFVGTPYWMAPEVITEGKTYDQKADVWSLGITIYEMAMGNPPLADVEQMRVIMLIPKSKPPRLPLEGDFSPAMRDFVAACLNEEPKERATSEELNKLKWIKTYAKTPVSVLKEVIQSYNAWTKAGGMRMSLIGAETADWGEAGNRDSFAFDGRETGEGWEFNTLRSAREWDEDDEDGQGQHAPIPIRDHPLLRLFDIDPSEGATTTMTTSAGGGMYGQRGAGAADGVNASTWRQGGATATNEPTATLRAQQAPPQLTQQQSLGGAAGASAAVLASTMKPPLGAAHVQEKASFTGTGNTPFRFGVGGGIGSTQPASPLNEVVASRANVPMRKRSQSLTKPSGSGSGSGGGSAGNASSSTAGTAIVIPDSRSLHDLGTPSRQPPSTSSRPTALRMGRAESSDTSNTLYADLERVQKAGELIAHHRQSHGGSDPTTAGVHSSPSRHLEMWERGANAQAYSRLARLRAGYVQTRRDSGSTGGGASDEVPVTPTGAQPAAGTSAKVASMTAAVLEKGPPIRPSLEGPPLRPLDFAALQTKEQVSTSLGKTVDELGKWLDVLSFGLGRAVHSEL
ncbi:related to ser/thr protein kinase [Sporisorium reilianum SRZ2]|uniref:non-specific serine/threonine protein kinase n=1 Tax=Sporisorium reilianum (strain SRZ2) TaxID=999809 RepID=E6ZUT7_SPORE|nr:related to ser/thr protein kinase [Sporisorium reilianum SRZ2]